MSITDDVKRRFNEDIKQKINPLYDISTVVHKDVLKELQDLFEAVALSSVRDAIEQVEQMIDEEIDKENKMWEEGNIGINECCRTKDILYELKENLSRLRGKT